MSDAATPGEVVELEREVRLSRSRLWALQRGYFERAGVTAWQGGIVPHYITSNAFLADAYARAVIGLLRDGGLDAEQPLYVIELGAGCGRFGFHFLSRLRERLARMERIERLPRRRPRVRYVLTDLAPKNVEFYLAHPSLQPLLQDGSLDCAVLDLDAEPELRLQRSGEVLGPGAIKNPVVFLANYVFDGLPNDAFSLRGGRLHEALVTLRAPASAPAPDDPAQLARLGVRFTHRLVPAPDGEVRFYGRPDWDRLLAGHAGGEGCFLFPVSGLAALGRLCALASDRLLLLSADKGSHHRADQLGPEPDPVVHGSFSLAVNYFALAGWVRDRGGTTIHGAHRQASLSLNAFLLGGPFPEAELACEEALCAGGPDDLFTLKKALDWRYETLTLEQILALCRVLAYDPRILHGCLPAIHQKLPQADARLREDLRDTLDKVRAAYFPIGEEADFAPAFSALAAALTGAAAGTEPGPGPGADARMQRAVVLGHRLDQLRVTAAGGPSCSGR
jgi:hypothetical protein